MKTPSLKTARNVAMDYLARREHSRLELENKLNAKEFEKEEIAFALDRLQSENLQSDSRFAQSYIRYRAIKGFGPVKIKHELNAKGVSAEVIQQAEINAGFDWMEQLVSLNCRKFSQSPPQNLKDKQKRVRFLQQRGFSTSDIMRLFVN
ncbi:MAG: regulatory protein RecX [Gammaproteobacteria bacterium]|nr:regulatory protein RecX [Gammaproteobacteria bacterium]